MHKAASHRYVASVSTKSGEERVEVIKMQTEHADSGA